MSDIIKKSDALKANLLETKSASGILSEEELFLFEISTPYPSIKKRMESFFKEKHHRFSDTDELVEGYRWILLENLWIFIKHPEKEKILFSFAKEFQHLISLNLSLSQKDRLVKTLLAAIETFLDFFKEKKLPTNLVNHYIDILDQVVSSDSSGQLEASSYLKNYLNNVAEIPEFHDKVFDILKKAIKENSHYWSSITPFGLWEKNLNIEYSKESMEIDEILKTQIPSSLFESSKKMIENAKSFKELLAVPDFSYFTEKLRALTDMISSPEGKIYYIFYLLELESMSSLREYLLFDLNRILKVVSFDDEEKGALFITRMFNFFKPVQNRFQSAVLDCIKTLGIEIVSKAGSGLADHYFEKVIEAGFIYPGVKGVNQDWQIIMNKNHVKNIRTWLEIISINPQRCMKLLSALLINLKIGGVFISDTDLFQNDVTRFLNSQIGSSYHMARQISVLFPVYFNEIGAEGELRKISTAIDELFHRNDRLIHFLRKQIHAESNNTHIQLVKDIFEFWLFKKRDKLLDKIPLDVFESLDVEEPSFLELHKIASVLSKSINGNWNSLFEMELDAFSTAMDSLKLPDNAEKNKVQYLFKLNLLLREKYYFNPGNVTQKLRQFNYIPADTIESLEESLNKEDWKSALKKSFKVMSYLKTTVLSSEKTEGVENIYYKRHIAIGIPSMYGEYREPKFEALGMIFRMERFVSLLMDRIISETKLNYISAETLSSVAEIINLFKEGLELGGITNENLISDLNILNYSLESSSFSVNQYTNIFEFLTEDLSKIVVDFFLGLHDRNLKLIIEQYIDKHGMTFSSEKSKERYIHKRSEEFYRDVIASSFLIQNIDNLINNILTLFREIPTGLSESDMHMIMSYRNNSIISSLAENNPHLDNQVFLGAKGYFLKKIREYGMPVPPGFILTTELFRRRTAIIKHPVIKKEINSMIYDNIKVLEKATSLEYGNPDKPLLLSIRSGSAISMPGAMNTFLNVGMNDEFVEKLCKKENYGWTAWDCYRRLIQSWGMSFGVDRDIYDKIMADYKKLYKVEKKVDFKPAVMREISGEYMKTLVSEGIDFPQNLNEQLMLSIHSVFDSWDSARAEVYRQKMNIAPEWGTAVIVQKMVLGNINYDSGTGVIFTREPFSGEREVRLYGDFVMCSQGEDIVGGLVHPYPVTEKQRLSANYETEISMEKDFPQIYAELANISAQLVHNKGFGHQEIEFTFETKNGKDLHILQTRQYHKSEATLSISIPEEAVQIGEGTGIGGSVLIGRATFSEEDIAEVKKNHPGEKIIVIRPDTVSDDIGMIFEADGLLTSRGGATSHAAVTAARLGKTGVVNCRALVVYEEKKICKINQTKIEVGDKIIIDGKYGLIYCL
ncbi:MAG: PEP/pyruvate-binding domain-containing protein [bacterium]